MLAEAVCKLEGFEGRYKDKVIQVDSSRTGAEEEAMIERLLKVEHTEEPTEIVIHVNMLKEGWDVTNLYTIVPLRAANARTLIEQSIGRGLRLPYGRRTGVTSVDRLNIVAHDKFQEIIDEANRPDSVIRLQAVVLDPEELTQKTVTVVSQSQLATKLGLQPPQVTSSTRIAGQVEAPVFAKPEEQKVAQITYEVIRRLETQPGTVPTVGHLTDPAVQAVIVREVEVRADSSRCGRGEYDPCRAGQPLRGSSLTASGHYTPVSLGGTFSNGAGLEFRLFFGYSGTHERRRGEHGSGRGMGNSRRIRIEPGGGHSVVGSGGGR